MFRKALTTATIATVAGLLAAFLALSFALAQQTPSASRSLPTASVAPGGQVVVTITASDYGDFGAVAETLPEGFTYVESDFTGRISQTGQQVRFIFQGRTVDPFTYTVTASSTPRTYTFSGELRDEDTNSYDVGGDSSITVTSPPVETGPRATRSLPTASVAPGGQVVVTITASDYGDFGAVAETLPEGFTYVESDFTGRISQTGQQVRFIFQGRTVDPFTYTVTASSTPRTYTFSGELRDEDTNSYDVGGDSSITVTSPPVETGPRATRSLPTASVAPGGQVVVTITASDYGDFGGVAETLPTGFSYVGDTFTEGDVKVTGQNVRFVFQGTVDPFTYTVRASSTPGTYTFRGSLRDEDRIDHTVGGDSSIRVDDPPRPRPRPTRTPTPTPTPTPMPTPTMVPPTPTPTMVPPHADTDHGPAHADTDHGPAHAHADADHGPAHADADHGPAHAHADHGPAHADADHGPAHADPCSHGHGDGYGRAYGDPCSHGDGYGRAYGDAGTHAHSDRAACASGRGRRRVPGMGHRADRHRRGGGAHRRGRLHRHPDKAAVASST